MKKSILRDLTFWANLQNVYKIKEVANGYDCDITESKFELQSRYYLHFRIEKGTNPNITSNMG